MDRIIQYRITSEQSGLMVTDILKQNGFSSHLITNVKMLEKGITIDNQKVLTNRNVYEGEILKVTIIEEKSSEKIIPTKMKLDIQYEDEDILIIDKSAHLPIHPSRGNFDNTLANGVAYYYKKQEKNFVYRCINRLDKNTTGLLILAKNKLSSCILTSMVANRKIHREYLAIVEGITNDEDIIIAPIARTSDSSIERCVDFNTGEYAKTYYRKVDSNDNCSLIALKLETGKTHQIRVHMKYVGHPLLGDELYNGDCSRISRQALHSHKLVFEHPITKRQMSFTSSMPYDMQCLYPNIIEKYH